MSLGSSLVEAASLFYFVGVLSVAGFLDLRHREVDPLLWVAALPAAPGFAAYGIYTKGLPPEAGLVLVAASLAPAAVAAILYRLCMMGGADVAALAFTSLAGLGLPEWTLIPPGFLAVAYSMPAAAALFASEAILSGCIRGCRPSPEEVARSHRRMWLVFDYSGGAEEGCGVAGDPPTLASQGARGRPAIPLVAALAMGGVAAALLGDAPILKLLLDAQP